MCLKSVTYLSLVSLCVVSLPVSVIFLGEDFNAEIVVGWSLMNIQRLMILSCSNNTTVVADVRDLKEV